MLYLIPMKQFKLQIQIYSMLLLTALTTVSPISAEELCEPYKQSNFDELKPTCLDPNYINICYVSFNNHKEYYLLNSFLAKVQKLAKTTKKIRAIEWLQQGGDAKETFQRMVGSKMKCHALVISGHHTGTWGGHRASRGVSLTDVENFSCKPDNRDFFSNLRFVWLQGCRTLGQESGVAAADRDLVTFNAERVARDLDIDGLAQLNQFRLQQDYADIFDRENPYSSRLNRTFESAYVFGWTMTAPGEKANSENSMLQHYGNAVLNFEAKTRRKSGPLENPLKLKTASSAQRYYDFMVDSLSGKNACPECLTKGWIQHGNVSKNKGRFGVDNPDLSFLNPLKFNADPLIKTSREIDCRLRHSDDPKEIVSTLEAALKDPRLASLTLHSVREVIGRSNSEYGRAPLELALIKRTLRNSQSLNQLLFLKLTSPHIGLVRKLEHYAFYVDVTRQRLPELEKLVREKSIHFLRNTTDPNMDRAVQAKESMLMELFKLELVNSELLQELINDPNPLNKETAINFILNRWPKHLRGPFKDAVLTTVQSNVSPRFNKLKSDYIRLIMSEMGEWLSPEIEKELLNQTILAFEAAPPPAAEFSTYSRPTEGLVSSVLMAQIEWPRKLDFLRRIMAKTPALEQARIFSEAVKSRNDVTVNAEATALALKDSMNSEARELILPGISNYSVPPNIIKMIAPETFTVREDLNLYKERPSALVTVSLLNVTDSDETMRRLEVLWDKAVAAKIDESFKRQLIAQILHTAWNHAVKEPKQKDRFVAIARKHMASAAHRFVILEYGVHFSERYPDALMREAAEGFDLAAAVTEPKTPREGWSMNGSVFATLRDLHPTKYLMPYINLLEKHWAKHTSAQARQSMIYEIDGFTSRIFLSLKPEQVDLALASAMQRLTRLNFGPAQDYYRTRFELAVHVGSYRLPEGQKWLSLKLKALAESTDQKSFDTNWNALTRISGLDGPAVVEVIKGLYPQMIRILAQRSGDLMSHWHEVFQMATLDSTAAFLQVTSAPPLAEPLRGDFYGGAVQTVCGRHYSKPDKSQVCPALVNTVVAHARKYPLKAETMSATLGAILDPSLFQWDVALEALNAILESPEFPQSVVIEALKSLPPVDRFSTAKFNVLTEWLAKRNDTLDGHAVRVLTAANEEAALAQLALLITEADKVVLAKDSEVKTSQVVAMIANSKFMACKVEILRWWFGHWEKGVREQKLDVDGVGFFTLLTIEWKIPTNETVAIAARMIDAMEDLHRQFDGPEIGVVTANIVPQLAKLLRHRSVRGANSLAGLQKLHAFAVARMGASPAALYEVAHSVLASKDFNSAWTVQLESIFAKVFAVQKLDNYIGGGQSHPGVAALIRCFVHLQMHNDRRFTPNASWLEKIMAVEKELDSDSLNYLLALGLNSTDPELLPMVNRLWATFESRRISFDSNLQAAAFASKQPVDNGMIKVKRLLRAEIEGGYSLFREMGGDTAGSSPLAILIRSHGVGGALREEILLAVDKMKTHYSRSFEDLALAVMLSPEPIDERRKWVNFVLRTAHSVNGSVIDNLKSRLPMIEEMPERDRFWFLLRMVQHYAPSQQHGYILWDLIEQVELPAGTKETLFKEYERLY